MEQHGNTVTDPIWANVVMAAFVVFVVITLFVIVDSVLRALLRRWQQAGAAVDRKVTAGLAEIDLARWDRELDGGVQ